MLFVREKTIGSFPVTSGDNKQRRGADPDRIFALSDEEEVETYYGANYQWQQQPRLEATGKESGSRGDVLLEIN